MRYIAFFLTLIFGVLFLRTWVGNLQNMQNSISAIKSEIAVVQEETRYMENFRLPYLSSERAPYFLGHENGVLYKDEYVVRIKQRKLLQDGVGNSVVDMQQEFNDSILISSPKESWIYFFKDKFDELESLGIRF